MSMLVHDLGLSRRACDRCHSQKLRCRRENNNDPCARCQRAGVDCAPRPLKSRHRPRTQSTQHAAPMSHINPTQSLVNPADQTNKDVPGTFHLSPSSLLDFPSDVDLGLDFASPQSEMGNPLEMQDMQSRMDLGPMQSHPQSESHGVPQSSYLQTPSTSTLMSCSQPKTTNSRRRLSLARTVSQDVNGLVDFEHGDGMTLNTGSDNSATNCGYRQPGPSQPGPSQPQSNGSGIPGPDPQQTLKPTGKSTTSWVYRLSDINVELHQHMQAIMSINIEHSSSWTSSKTSNGTNSIPELAVDHTFKLSYQYTEILDDIFSQCRTNQASTGPPLTSLALDQPSQLLILSGYLCLVESYDQILQHIKTWAEVRMTIGETTTAAEKQPLVQLPSVTIGCFQLSASSSIWPLVLICIIEATMTQIHHQVNEMMRPVRTTGEQAQGDDGLSGIAKVTVQAIRAKEDTTVKLLHVVWRLALQCGENIKPGAGAN